MEYTPLELASIYESRAKMTEDLIRRHEEGELHSAPWRRRFAFS